MLHQGRKCNFKIFNVISVYHSVQRKIYNCKNTEVIENDLKVAWIKSVWNRQARTENMKGAFSISSALIWNSIPLSQHNI